MQEPAGTITLDEAIVNNAQPYDPTRHLVNLNGKGEYLEVKWRILWCKKEHPEASIETEFMNMIDCDLARGPAIFRARITFNVNDQRTTTTGWGSETAGDFRDFIEKAETKAIGRALAAAGYGTQFCQDHDFGNAQIPVAANAPMRVVDAPVDLASSRGRRPSPPNDQRQIRESNQPRPDNRPDNRPAEDIGSQLATERQTKFIGAIAREVGLDEQDLDTWCEELYGRPLLKLNRRDASALIEALQRRKNELQ